MSEADALFTALRQASDAESAAAVERLVRDGPDHALNRVNALAFAQAAGIDEEKAIAAFLHAAHIGLFELSWNVLCPGCGGVLDANATLYQDEFLRTCLNRLTAGGGLLIWSSTRSDALERALTAAAGTWTADVHDVDLGGRAETYSVYSARRL